MRQLTDQEQARIDWYRDHQAQCPQSWNALLREASDLEAQAKVKRNEADEARCWVRFGPLAEAACCCLDSGHDGEHKVGHWWF